MELSIYDFLIGLSMVVSLIYAWLTWNYSYWAKKNVPGPRPIPIFGNFKEWYTRQMSQGQILKKLYDQYPNEPFIGVYELRTPVMILRDPDVIRDVLVRDFNSFGDRGIFRTTKKSEPMGTNLFSLDEARWRPLRTKLSPTFTSGKLKEMFYLILECANHIVPHVDRLIEKNDHVIEVTDMIAKYSTDVIGACAFGLKMNAVDDDNSQFRQIGRMIVSNKPFIFYKRMLKEQVPWLHDILEKLIGFKGLSGFFYKLMADTIDFRKKNDVRRNDFVDLLMDIQADPSKINDIELTHELLTAQAFIFFVAGFDTSSNLMSNVFYEMALNPDIQEKMRAEILEELKKTDGEIKYESIKNMNYLHQVFCESARRRSSGLALSRIATKDYTFRNSHVTIPKGTKLYIPIWGVHLDPKNYPDPYKFDPERFTEENIAARHPSIWLAFGDGPRNCIGARFANYQVKVGLITIFKNYRIKICEQTEIPQKEAPSILLYLTQNGIHLRFEKIEPK